MKRRKMFVKKGAAVIAAIACAVSMSFASPVSAAKYTSYDVLDSNNVICTGDFDCLTSGNIIFYPADMLENTQTYPVVVWANGTMCAPVLYYELLSEIAAGGYIVVTNTDMMAADGTSQVASVDFILEKNEDESSVFYNRVNTEKIGAAGHSQGGRSAVNAAVLDSRIDCVLSVAGSNYTYEAEKLSAPALFFTGTSDLIVLSSLWVKPAYNKCKGTAVYASLKNGIHTTCCTLPEIYSEYAVSWFDAFLKDDQSAKEEFMGSGKLSKDKSWTGYASKNF